MPSCWAWPLKGRTEKVDHLEEPAEHQDEISQFFYITSFIEYLDYLHRAGDAVHSRGVGEGDFPDSAGHHGARHLRAGARCAHHRR